jgi:hypothetical protein
MPQDRQQAGLVRGDRVGAVPGQPSLCLPRGQSRLVDPQAS